MPDLLEAIMRPKDPVEEELRQKLFKITNYVQNHKNEGFSFLDPGYPKFSRRRPTQPSRPVGFKQETALHTPINPIFGPARAKYIKNDAKQAQTFQKP